MRKIEFADVFPPRVYEPIRDELRRRVIEIKRPRRVHLGPVVTLVFENRATLISQVCEMLRAEKIEEPAKVQDEIDVYNSLLPDEGELSATLFVEITDPAAIAPTLGSLVGLDTHVALEIGQARVPAIFEGGRTEGGRISSVQYLRFALPEAARRALGEAGVTLAIVSDLDGYTHRTELSEDTRISLAADLAPA